MKKLWITFLICWAVGLMGVMLSSKGYGEWARIVAIVFTLAGMVVGFTMFAAGIMK